MTPDQGAKILETLTGLLLSTVSSVLASIVYAIVKYVKNLDSMQFAFYVSLSIVLFGLPPFAKSETNPLGPSGYRLLLLLYSIFMTVNGISVYLVAQYLPLGEGSAITASIPAAVLILARLILKESISKTQILLSSFTLIGIFLLSKLPENLMEKEFRYDDNSIYGLIAAILHIFAQSVRLIILRKLRVVSSNLVVVNLGIFSTIFIAILIFVINGQFTKISCGIEIFLVLIMTFLSYISTLLITLAMKYDKAGPVAVVRYSVLVVSSFLWQMMFFKDIPSPWSVAGAVIVTTASGLIGMNKWLSSLPDGSLCKQKLRWLSM